MLRRLWRALPPDGRGFLRPVDPDARRIAALASRHIWGRVPWPVRPVAIGVARLLWCFKAAGRVRQFAQHFGYGRGEALGMFADACALGLQPTESFIWRNALGGPPRPLSIGTAAKVMAALGDPGQRALLSDKLAASRAFAAAGIRVPPLDAVLERGETAPLLPAGDGALFVKPRGGSRSRATFSIERRADASLSVDGVELDAAALEVRLREALRDDALLVQHRLDAAPELADLATLGRAPYLRITTAREPGGAPYVHSALLSVLLPGESRRSFLRGYLRVPVELETGKLRPGYCFGIADRRFDVSPWHGGAPITGRIVPHFEEAARAVIAAAEVVDRLPIVSWDAIVTAHGPVILEGNTEGAWLLNFISVEPEPLDFAAILNRWADKA